MVTYPASAREVAPETAKQNRPKNTRHHSEGGYLFNRVHERSAGGSAIPTTPSAIHFQRRALWQVGDHDKATVYNQ